MPSSSMHTMRSATIAVSTELHSPSWNSVCRSRVMACQRRVRAAFGGDGVEGKDHACVKAEDALYYGRLRGRERGGIDDGFSKMKDLRQFWRVFVPEAFIAVGPFVVDAEGEGHEETLDLEDRDGVLPCFLFLACWGGEKK